MAADDDPTETIASDVDGNGNANGDGDVDGDGNADGDGDVDGDGNADGDGDVDGDGNVNGDSGVDVEDLLERAGFAAETGVLTHRQAEVLALREHGLRQSDIADRLGTSRANVSSVESSARENVAKARETVAFAEALSAPVRVEIGEGTDLYDVPSLVYDACDASGVKVNHTAPDLMKVVGDAAGDAVQGREVRSRLFVTADASGTIRVRRP